MKKSNIAVTVDIVMLHKRASSFELLLIQRRNDPFKLSWALPGGFVDEGEDLEAAAERELLEETGLRAENLNQLKAFGNPDRDPRGHTVSVVFIGFVSSQTKVTAGDDAESAAWFDVNHLPDLAFDHSEIISFALSKVQL